MATKTNVPLDLSGAITNVNAFDDLAGWIADPPTGRPLRDAIGRSGRGFCNLVGATPAFAKSLLGPGFAASALLCKPYWDNEGYDAPVENSPFTGGQCVGATYTISGTITDGGGRFCSDGGAIGSNTFPVSFFVGGSWIGPITSVSALPYGGGCRGGSNGYFVRIVSDGGARTQDYQVAEPSSNRSYVGFSVAASFNRVGGGADCGNPPGDLGPGGSPPPTPTFPPGLEPGVDPDGQPFFWVPPEEPVPGEDVEVPPPSDPGGGAGGGPTEPPVAGEEQEGTPGDEEFPPPEDGRRWVGCCIRLTSIPPGTGTVPGTSPETILTQVVGNARLLFDSLTGDGYDTPVQIRSAGLCLWEPVKGLSPKGVRVNLKPGFEYAVTPYSVAEEE